MQGTLSIILDAYALRWSWSQLQQYFNTEHYDVIGLTAMTPMRDVVAKAVKICRPSARFLVIGGPHPTAVRAAVFAEMPELDAAIVGEGEESFVQLLSWWSQSERTASELPPGVLAPEHNFRDASPPPLATLPLPARDLLPNERYRYLFSTHRKMGTLITSRGCPFRCTFCDKSVSGSRWRARSAKSVVDEMTVMVEHYGIRFINIYDDNFTLNRGRVMAICEEILARDLDIDWKCEGRVDAVDKELLELMKKAGCKVIAFGVESANRETLALLRKDILVEQSIQAFALMREVGIRSLAYMILGAPGEQSQDVLRSIRFCDEIGADYAQFSSLTLMPGTPLTEALSGNHRISVGSPLDGDLDRPTATDMSPQELSQLVRKAWLGFYGQPRRLLRLSKDLLHSGSLFEGVHMVPAVVDWATLRWRKPETLAEMPLS